MKENAGWEKLLAGLRSGKHTMDLVLVLGAAGMLLILLSGFWPQGSAAPAADSQESDPYAYARQLTQQLEELLSQVEGAGRVKVMVTLESGEQTVFVVDTREGETETENTHVLLQNGEALAETVRMPAVSGVAVVCEGGDQVHVVAQITELLASLLDLSTSRISVAKMN